MIIPPATFDKAPCNAKPKATPQEVINAVNEAVSMAITSAREDKSPILCLGSLYMYGEIVNAVNNCQAK